MGKRGPKKGTKKEEKKTVAKKVVKKTEKKAVPKKVVKEKKVVKKRDSFKATMTPDKFEEMINKGEIKTLKDVRKVGRKNFVPVLCKKLVEMGIDLPKKSQDLALKRMYFELDVLTYAVLNKK